MPPATGTDTRYPPENIENGPHLPTIFAGSPWVTMHERHVYQAGSRVCAERVGSWRKPQPRASRTTPIARNSTTGWTIHLVRWSGSTACGRAGTSVVNAMASGTLLSSARRLSGQAGELPKDRRRKGGREHAIAGVSGLDRRSPLERL